MEITWRVIRGEGEGENGEKVQGIRSIIGRYKIDRGRLRIVWEMEKPWNLYVQPWALTKLGRGMWEGGMFRVEENKGEKKMGQHKQYNTLKIILLIIRQNKLIFINKTQQNK